MKKILLASLCMLMAASSVSQATIDVNEGWDLFFTDDSTEFMGLNWEGVPLGTFDFGGTIGVQSTGGIDTIVQRIDPASVAGAGNTDTINIELVAMQLVSTVQFDFDGDGPSPFDYHYITLQSGQSTTGEMDITFTDSTSGSFDSFFDVYFDLRVGSLTGTILDSDSITTTSSDNDWNRVSACPYSVVIDDVNNLLNGTDTAEDFWPQDPVEYYTAMRLSFPSGATPEPATLGLLLIGGLAMLRRRR